MGDIPVGNYNSSGLANLGIGHGAADGGAGYTYFAPKYRQYLPFAARQVLSAGRGDDAGAGADGPSGVQGLDQRRLNVRIAEAVNVFAGEIVRLDGVFRFERQITTQGQRPLSSDTDLHVRPQHHPNRS